VARRKSVGPANRWINLRPASLFLILPIAISALTFTAVGTGLYEFHLANQTAKRLQTDRWEDAAETMKSAQPDYHRKFAYYEIKPGQSIENVAHFFGVPVAKLKRMNAGLLIPGATIKIPPVERPLTAVPSNHALRHAVVTVDGDLLRITNEYYQNRPIFTTFPELMVRLRAYNAISKIGPKSYRLNRAISVQGDIRLIVTPATVRKIELVSTPDVLASLVFDQSSVLFKGVEITSIDPSTGKPDVNSPNGRSFLRMKNGRMDVIDSKISWLGNGLKETLSPKARVSTAQNEGGTYGFSYRISKGKLGVEVSTGWVENSTFEHNHFGAYSFGASGIMWKDNLFTHNEVYGLDPHDDSNNALVVGNRFLYNGKHGFIVSKRCNFNVIRNNTSVGNKLHGFMLHEDSAYNVIEDNVSYDNVDNFVIYGSNWNTIRHNVSYLPRKTHVRVNAVAHNTYIVDNKFYGGPRGVYLYDGAATTYIADNRFPGVGRPLHTKGAKNTFFGDNRTPSYDFKITPGDTVIFGKNSVDREKFSVPSRAEIDSGDLAE
jgi:hypothetical protein